MTSLQIIDALCHIVEDLIDIVLKLSSALEQERCLTAAELKEVDDVLRQYSSVIGADEP